MNKETFIVFAEWEEDLEDLSNDEIANLTKAFFAYVKRGEKPTFSDRMVRSCWRKIQQASDRSNKAYEEKCEKNRENGKKGGAPKGNQNATKQPNNQNNRTVEKTTETTLPDRDRERDPDPDRGRGRERDSRTSLTTTTSEEIVTSWNDQPCTQDISSALFPEQRRDRTEMAMAIIGGLDRFLQLISGISEQAYFKDRNVDFDWFVDPKNFQSILEGKYKEPRKKKKEGWE